MPKNLQGKLDSSKESLIYFNTLIRNLEIHQISTKK